MRVVEGLDRLQIPYAIGGSFASSVHGLPRTTNDADIVAVITAQQAAGIAAEYAEEFYVDEEMVQRAVRTKRAFNMIHFDTTFKIDVFIAASDFQDQEIERRQMKTMGEEQQYSAYFSSPEDIILAKLDWYRKGGGVSEQQCRDITNVIRIQGERLDVEYLRRWASNLGLSNLLEQALEESLSE